MAARMCPCMRAYTCLSVCLSVSLPCCSRASQEMKVQATMRCYERDFMLSLSGKYQTDIIEAFISTSRYLDLLNIDNPFFNKWFPQNFS